MGWNDVIQRLKNYIRWLKRSAEEVSVFYITTKYYSKAKYPRPFSFHQFSYINSYLDRYMIHDCNGLCSWYHLSISLSLFLWKQNVQKKQLPNSCFYWPRLNTRSPEIIKGQGKEKRRRAKANGYHYHIQFSHSWEERVMRSPFFFFLRLAFGLMIKLWEPCICLGRGRLYSLVQSHSFIHFTPFHIHVRLLSLLMSLIFLSNSSTSQDDGSRLKWNTHTIISTHKSNCLTVP